jgi:hypothetical protein
MRHTKDMFLEINSWHTHRDLEGPKTSKPHSGSEKSSVQQFVGPLSISGTNQAGGEST